ncbi:MAG: Adenylate cyclase [Labilithrix sp.]|nr:Adenylate cyclase [Labilithrix sp.]
MHEGAGFCFPARCRLLRCKKLLDVTDLSLGKVISDRYVLSALLGEGAAGWVWRAHDRRLGLDVALKVLRPEMVEQPGMFVRFARESDLSTRMLSPNVVKVLGGGLTENGVPYIAYEGLEGEDLATKLRRSKRLSLNDLTTVVTHLCRGLARAHAVGVIHCDIKPENTFLTKDTDGRLLVKILDFGVAELMVKRSADNPYELCGTLEYLAPEVFLGKAEPTPQSDLYSVGVVAYECCTGRVPRAVDSVQELVAVLAAGTVEPAGSHRLEVTPELDAWFARAIHDDPSERFASAKQMAEALGQVMAKITDRGSDRRLIDAEMRPRMPSIVEVDTPRTGTYSIVPGRADEE